MVQKFYGIETKEGVKRATVISTAFAALISCGAYFVGSLSRLFFTEVPQLDGKVNYDLIIPMILSKLPVVLLAVILVLVHEAGRLHERILDTLGRCCKDGDGKART